MKKFFILKFVLACLTLCISLNARTQTRASLPSSFTETPAPTGEVRFPAEFEPVQAVVIAHYQEGRNLPARLIKQMAQEVKVITLVNTDQYFTTEQVRNLYASELTEEELANCEFIEAPLNGRWTRDFTPWIIFNGTEPAIVENIYNRCYVHIDNNNNVSYITDPNNDSKAKLYDDAIPQYFKEYFKDENGNTISLPMYGMKVVHTGGNMMQDGRGVGVSDSIVHTESEMFLGQTSNETDQKMKDYLGINPYHVTLDPQGKYIAHVDCWGKFLAPDKILIAQVDESNSRYGKYEEVANYFANAKCCWGYPYKVYRVFVPEQIGNYTNFAAPYTNSLILNKKVFVPLDADTKSQYNEAALQVYRDAMPGYEIIGVEYNYDNESGDWDGWYNTDALHCRTHEIMDFNMLFVDHRNVLFGEQAYKESYPITAKFIAYSGDNITETKLHYSINGGAYTTVEMTATGNADEYAANITGYNIGDVIEYYVTGVDASGRTCVQPQFGELEPHTFTVGEASDEEPEPTPEPEQPAQPVLDITKYHRIKTASGTGYQYLTIFNHDAHTSGPNGGVGVAMLDEDNAGQMFKFEDADDGKYYLKSADGYYIYCQSWNVDAIDGTQKSALWGFDSENNFELQCDKGYFKVENNYVFCNAEKETRATTIATWGLEEVPVSVTISAASTTVTVNESVQLNATATGGTGNYTYSWSPATDLDNTTIANPTFTPTTSGEYIFTCTVTDNGEIATSNTVTITVNEAQQGGGDTEEVVTIDGNLGNNYTTSRYVPIDVYNKWTISKQYYTKDEIGKDNGTITHIAFKAVQTELADNVSSFQRNIDIYMRNEENIPNNTEALTENELVFHKEDFEFTIGDWTVIELNKTFEYTGSNLLVCVNDFTGSYENYKVFFATFSSEDRAFYKSNYTAKNKYDPTTSITLDESTDIPYIQLTFSDGTTPDPTPTPDPLVLTADKTTFTANGTDAVTFSVTQGGNAVNDATIYVDGVAQAGYTFSTTTAKEYTVYAQKGDLTSDEITITAEAPAVIKPVIDLTKYYRIKVNSGTYANQYLHISNTANTVITSAKTDDQAQIFKIEDAGNGNYYLKSANGLYIKCDAASGAWWNIYGNATNKTPLLFEYTNETEFYIRDYDKITGTSATNDSNSANSYFKVENGTVYCDAPTTNTDVVTWTLEEVPLSVTISADNNTVTVNESVQLNATAIGGTGNYTYSWSPADGLSSTTIANPTFTSATAGDYTFTCTVTDNGEPATSNTITITVNEAQQGGEDTSGGVVTIGENGNISPSNVYPYISTYTYSTSQQIYTAAEIGKKNGGTIEKIEFYLYNADVNKTVKDVKIYIIHTDKESFTTTSDWDKNVTSEHLVYEGNPTITNSVLEIPLTKSFEYNGTSNLLVCFDVNSKQEEATPYKIYETSAYRAMYRRDNNNNYGPDSDKYYNITASGRSYSIPVISLTFEGGNDGGDEPTTPDAPNAPTNLTASATETTVTLKWDAVDGASYNIYQGEDLLASSITETTYTVENLTANTSYTFSVKAVKDELESVAATVTVNTLAIDPLILKANKTTLTADGIDVVTFTVTQGGNAVNDATIYVDGTAQAGYTFTTTTARTYTVYAQKGDLTSNEITINAEIALDPTIIDGVYYYPDGRVTYNIGTDRQYTLIVGTDPTKPDYGAIKQDNVYIYGDGNNITYEQKNDNKPQAPTTLILPDKVLSGTEWITVTKVEAYAFDDLFEDGVEPGNELNALFTNLVIPSTIQEISTYTFGFSMGQGSSIICYAKTPPTLADDCTNNPFISTTYNNSILYVPAESVEAYKAAEGWGTPRKQGGYYFKNIYPITIPTYVGDGDWKNNANNWRTYVKNNDETYIEQYGVMPNAGEDVLIDGNVTIPEGYVANAGNINIISGSITIADGGQLIHTNAGLTVTMEKKITGYVSSTSPTSWYTISSPLYPSVKAKDVNGLLSNDYDLYRYDEPTHYWDNIEDLEDLEGPQGNWETLDAGRGYLYANSGDVTLQFNGVANHTSASYTLTRGTEDGKLEGFHLVGNPFTHNIYMSSAFETDVTLADGYYALTNEGAWGAKLSTDEPIKPCQGILIQATEGEGTLTINKKVDPAPQTRSRSNNEFVAISIANNKYEDVAYVSFDVENPLEKVNHQNKNIPMVYIPAEDINYSIATIENDVEEIPVAFEAKTMGQYTIGAKSQNCEFEEMYLLDKMTGIKTNLLLESYTFMATTTDNPERFVIKLNKNANDLDNGNFIFINNNEMIINNIEGRASLQIFDVMGRYLCNYEVTGSANISTEEFSSGVYIIRLMDNNGVKTQKVVL